MISTQTWQATNARYLSTALEWVRLRLMQMAKPEPAVSPDQLKQAAEAMAGLEENDPPPALFLLGLQLGLSKFEREVLLLCAAMEFDTRIPALCAHIQGDPSKLYPTFALALALFDDPQWEALSPHRPLRYWQLIDVIQPGMQPLTTSALRADERIVSYLKGLNAPDNRLTTFLSPLESDWDPLTPLPASQEAAAIAIVDHWQRAASHDHPLPIVQLLGADPISKQLVAARAAAAAGRELYRVSGEALPVHLGDLETLARLWHRESRLLRLALYLDVQEVETGSPEHTAPVQRFLSRADGVIFLGTRESWPRLPRPAFSIDIERPTMAEQQAMWSEALGEKAGEAARQLAAQFNLNVTAITEIASEVLTDSRIPEDAVAARTWARCCTVTRPRLDALAQRLDPKATWADIVLPPEQEALLRQIAQQVGQRHTVYEEWGFGGKMNRGLGISVLFAGDSGTGKTMAAEVIANDLRLNLYRIDLSAVVSKYIGETEKNLRRVFDAAENGGVILFFDEADALFGRRTEVRDSHDRYANIEVNYLLQRIEAYRGLAILATNMKSALDPAFMRRLRFIVNFPCPNAQDRISIWKRVFPATETFRKRLELSEPDYERLGRLNVTGGNIHSIALNAAFAAAQSDSKVTLPVVLSAARTEFRKLDKPVNEADFR